MSKRETKQLEEFIEAYEDLTKENFPELIEGAIGGEGESVSEEDLRRLRSGKTYKRSDTPSPPPSSDPQSYGSSPPKGLAAPPVPPVSDQITMPNKLPLGGGSAPTPSPTPASGLIKVMPSGASVREYTSTDADYRAIDFVELAEDVMRNSGITDPADKIAFVRSRIKQGSEASIMMRTSAFTKPTKAKDYDAFRDHFLQVFGENVKHSLVKGVSMAVDRIVAGVEAQDMSRAQVDAFRVSEDLMKYLRENNWASATNMSTQNVAQFLEFFTYMLLLKRKTRQGTLALTYAPGDELYEFVVRLKTKMEEKHGESTCLASTVVASNVTSGIAALSVDQSHIAGIGSNKPVVVCSHCKKPGHTEGKCFALRRERRKNQRTGGVSGDQSPTPSQPKPNRDNRQSPVDTNKRPPQRSYVDNTQQHSTRSRGTQGGDSYCELHETNSHSTADCYTIARIRKDMREQGTRRVSGMSSGEASRPKKHDPT